MSEVFREEVILPASYAYAYPSLKSCLLTDSAAGRKALRDIEENRRVRHSVFPSLRGAYGVNSFHEVVNNNDYLIQKSNELDTRAPHRAYDNLIDPTSGFVSAGGDVDKNTGYTRIQSLAQLNKTPQTTTPKEQNNVQKNKLAASRELNYNGIWSPVTPTAWNSRKTLDIWIRSKLGGWTSDADPRKAHSCNSRLQPSPTKGQAQNIQDRLAMKYVYGASTQRGYEDVPWDKMLWPKRWPPALAVEDRSELSLYHHHHHVKGQHAAAEDWKTDTKADCKYPSKISTNKEGHVPIPSGYTLYEPLYSGHEAQIVAEAYRGDQRLDPGKQRSRSAPGPHDRSLLEQVVHKPSSDYRRKSRMSKMVTLVPPHNPFNTAEKV